MLSVALKVLSSSIKFAQWVDTPTSSVQTRATPLALACWSPGMPPLMIAGMPPTLADCSGENPLRLAKVLVITLGLVVKGIDCEFFFPFVRHAKHSEQLEDMYPVNQTSRGVFRMGPFQGAFGEM